MSHNWNSYNKRLKFSNAKNTGKINAFFSKQESSEKTELEVYEQSDNRQSSSDMVINFIVESESRPLASTSTAEGQFTQVAKSETWF